MIVTVCQLAGADPNHLEADFVRKSLGDRM